MGPERVHPRLGNRTRVKTPTPAFTPTFIGSLTRTFTARQSYQLVEAGKVELDAPQPRYRPGSRSPIPIRRRRSRAPPAQPDHGISKSRDLTYQFRTRRSKRAAGARSGDLPGYRGPTPWPAVLPSITATSTSTAGVLVIAAVSGETYTDYVKPHF
jgi:CubicO group peptidase (beta-lactamase class C family)